MEGCTSLGGVGSAPSGLHPAELHLPQVPWREATQPPAMRASAKGLQLPQQGASALFSDRAQAALVPTPLPSGLPSPPPTPYSTVSSTTEARRARTHKSRGVSAWPHPQRGTSRASAAFPAQPCTPLCGDVCTAPAFGIKLSSPRGAPVRICSRTSSADGGDVSSPSLPRLLLRRVGTNSPVIWTRNLRPREVRGQPEQVGGAWLQSAVPSSQTAEGQGSQLMTLPTM